MGRVILRLASFGRMWWGVLALLLVLLPALVSEASVQFSCEILIMALFAMSLNILMGYGGMISFGHAGFFGLGAYSTAILMTKASVPWGLAMLLGPVAAAIGGVLFGFFCVRLTAIYFAMLTFALAQIVYSVAFKWENLTGGDNGIIGITFPDFLSSTTPGYYFILVVVAVCVFALLLIANSAFGSTLKAIRENPERIEFVGINIKRFQLTAFVIAAFFAGAAGSLFAFYNQSIFPDYLLWTRSTEALIMCILGGMYFFIGPAVGAFVVQWLGTVLSRYTTYWPFALGMILLLLVLFLRGGIVGYLNERYEKAKAKHGQ
jgi:branched-chain amino acid transport system permease protein